jgi:hypothetical protein
MPDLPNPNQSNGCNEGSEEGETGAGVEGGVEAFAVGFEGDVVLRERE